MKIIAHTIPRAVARSAGTAGKGALSRVAAAGPDPRAEELLAPYVAQRLNFSALLKAEPTQRIALARDGVSATWLVELASRMDVPQDRIFSYLGISRSTAMRKIQQSRSLSADEGERVLGMARLIGLLEKMVKDSGNPKGFDAAHWLADWLEQPLPALAGQRPGAFMDTATGQQLVAGLLAQIQSGAYA